ncbi:MAG TPA: peptide-methionine (S)-S-oxide reductase MsrA [Hyphomonadaceae bacterium]|jgi:peptide-methionine (S)-S-oxide reductase|nr:peptide-methionine (S)-S-oxide reductase MsrA [Hyphomonadaceae bacterium]
MRYLIVLLALVFSPAAFAEKQQAVFAGGCFWCMEHDMQAIPGVLKVESGYTGGHLKNPSYEDVVTETTGHYESVRVTFDTDKISYEQLLNRYWPLVDPTDDGGQFCDRGPSYRPAIFVTPQQKAAAEASKAKVIDSRKVNGQVKVAVLPLGVFYPAEEYHRDFAKKNSEHYTAYRRGCGRDAILTRVWKQ